MPSRPETRASSAPMAGVIPHNPIPDAIEQPGNLIAVVMNIVDQFLSRNFDTKGYVYQGHPSMEHEMGGIVVTEIPQYKICAEDKI